MSERIEAGGDIGQVIDGNVNEAPRQNNVVNFHLAGGATAELTLTDLQRKRISELVKELCAITQEKPLDVYRVILRDFGAERMKELPRTKYRAVAAQIERWIGENKQGTDKAKAVRQLFHATGRHCEKCNEKDVSYRRLQRILHGQWVLSGILTITCALLFYKVLVPPTSASTAGNHCFYDGKPYSIGSTINPEGIAIRECTSATFDTSSPIWIKQRQ